MSYAIISNGDNTNSAVVEIVIDTATEISTLSTDYGSGSTCICTENSSVYMLGADKVWHEL